jgi:hypothetical protein
MIQLSYRFHLRRIILKGRRIARLTRSAELILFTVPCSARIAHPAPGFVFHIGVTGIQETVAFWGNIPIRLIRSCKSVF